jgi:hypothetical protein
VICIRVSSSESSDVKYILMSTSMHQNVIHSIVLLSTGCQSELNTLLITRFLGMQNLLL